MGRGGQPDYAQILDFVPALAVVEGELYGDWYRDPWGWPELKWLQGDPSQLEAVAQRVYEGSFIHDPLPIDVPKSNFGHRPATLFHVAERAVYQAAVDRVSNRKDFVQPPPWVFGWRNQRDAPTERSKNEEEWSEFRSKLFENIEKHPLLLQSDISSFFASVDSVRLVEQLRDVTGGITVDLIERFQHANSSIPTRSGLPQRSFASATLAHFYLRRADDLLTARAKYGELLPVRWMDDFWLVAGKESYLRRTQTELTDILRELSLEPHAGKTQYAEGEAASGAVSELELSGLDQELRAGIPFASMWAEPGESVSRRQLPEFEELHHTIVAGDASVEQTKIRFFSTRVRKHALWDFLDQPLVDAMVKLPHGADHFSRAFRAADRWRDLQRWYVEYLEGEWNIFDWSAANLITMFPSGESAIEKSVLAVVYDAVVTAPQNAPRNSVFLAKLAAWDSASLRGVFLDLAANAPNWLLLRSAIFASLMAGATRRDVQPYLDRTESGRFLRAFLESTNYRVPRLDKDFG